ncbi:FAD:protein FMN transferase [candidate division KSB1 bacterium]|nr:FAD:protein FMN transferase [candidate division KSB1 bacterium]
MSVQKFLERRQRGKFVLCLFFLLMGGNCTPDRLTKPYQRTRILMGTFVTVSIYDRDLGHRQLEKAVVRAFSEIARIDSLMSTYSGVSLVHEINQRAGRGWVRMGPDLIEVMAKSLNISEKTNGAFDVTVAPLMREWDFQSPNLTVPDSGRLSGLLSRVGYRLVGTSGDNIFLKEPGMGIDLGGIAKGYAIDRAVEVLAQEGITSAIVEIGGDLKVLGERGEGEPWRIAIRHPRSQDSIYGTIPLSSGGVASSGDYERYFISGGRRYHHVLDPRTGYPARGCVSVTVLHPSATEADGWATAVFVMGPQIGVRLIEKSPDLEGIIIYQEGDSLKTLVSSGLRGKIKYSPSAK